MTEIKEEEALITFNSNSAKVLVKNNIRSYLVRWYCNDEYIGEYELSSGMWGAYPLNLGNWRIEFCDVVFYFKGSEQYDLSPFKTLKMNDEYDFSLILEENYG